MHQEEKYVRYFERVRELLASKCPELQVVQNQIPEVMRSQFYSSSTSELGNERMLGKTKFPRTGAFEVLFRGEYIFSKLGSGIWPHPDLLTDRLRDILDGNESAMVSSPKKSPVRRKSPTRSNVSFNPKPDASAAKAKAQPQSKTQAPKAVPTKKVDSRSSSDDERKEESFESPEDPSYNESFAEEKSVSPIPAPQTDSKSALPKTADVKASDLKADKSHKSLSSDRHEEFKEQLSSSQSKASVSSKQSPQEGSHKDLHKVHSKEGSDHENSEELKSALAKEHSKHSLANEESKKSLAISEQETKTLAQEHSKASLVKEPSKASLPHEESKKSLANSEHKQSTPSLAHEESKKSLADSKQFLSRDKAKKKDDSSSDEEDNKSKSSEGSHKSKKSSSKSSSKHSKSSSSSDEDDHSKHEIPAADHDSEHDPASLMNGEPEQDTEKPKVTKTYSLKIGLAQLVHKKIPYSNEEDDDREYEIKSSHPEFMDVKETVVHVPAGGNGKFKLTFAPVDEESEKTYYLYVTSKGDVKECIEIITKYEPAAA